MTVLAMATELLEVEPKWENIEQQHIFSAITTFLTEEKTENIPNANSLESWIHILQSSGYSEDTKWRLLELINNPVKNFGNCLRFIEKIVLPLR